MNDDTKIIGLLESIPEAKNTVTAILSYRKLIAECGDNEMKLVYARKLTEIIAHARKKFKL